MFHLVLDVAFFAACFNGWLLDFSSNESCSGRAGGEEDKTELKTDH